MRNKILNAIALIFIFFGTLAIIYSILNGTPEKALWFCYSGLIIMGISILFRNSYWLASQINILLIPTTIWSIDIFSYILTGNFLFGISAHFINYSEPIQRLIAMEHLLIPPLSLYALYKIKIKKTDFYKISLIQLILIFLITRLITPASMNVNCVFETCNSLNLATPYPISWFIIILPPVIITHLVLTSIKIFKK